MIITEKLLTLAAAYEQKAASLRLAAAELNGHQVAKKQARGGIEATIAEAALLRAQANGTNGHATMPQRVAAAWTPARRKAQAARMIARLKAGKGKLQKARLHVGVVAATRRKTEKFLAKIAAHDGPFIGTKQERVRFGILVHSGYLRSEGGGVVRTDKPFTV